MILLFVHVFRFISIKNHWPRQIARNFSSICSFWSFIDLYLTFKSLIHCIFVSGIISWASFILLHVIIHFFPQHHLLKRLFFPHWVFLPPLSKISWTHMQGFISAPLILSLWSMCLFYTPVSQWKNGLKTQHSKN